jgi:hypothetical protein
MHVHCLTGPFEATFDLILSHCVSHLSPAYHTHNHHKTASAINPAVAHMITY